jgi:hypothetical protein
MSRGSAVCVTLFVPPKPAHTFCYTTTLVVQSMVSQADLGIGRAPVATPTERRFVSAPNANPDFGVTLIETSLGTATKKRKMTSELTPDNADKVLTSSLDFSKFHIAVSEKAEMTEGEMFALLKSCIIDPNVGDLHLAGLSCCLTF